MTFAVPLSQGLHALIDDEDAPLVLPHKWSAQRSKQTYYAFRNDWSTGKARKVYLHRLLMGHPAINVDHKNGDGLDCRRRNMREATFAQNRSNARRPNRHGFMGARRYGRRWAAYIADGSRRVKVGVFDTAEEAGAAYAAAAREKYGEFAP